MLARLCDHMYTLYAALNRNFKIYKTYFYYIKLMGLIYFYSIAKYHSDFRCVIVTVEEGELSFSSFSLVTF